jgi:hypothetical protein
MKNSKVSWHYDPESRDLVFQGRLSQQDILSLELDALDRAVVMSPITSAADLFQTLELLWSRAFEQLPND